MLHSAKSFSTELDVFYADTLIGLYFLVCSYLCGLQLIQVLHSDVYRDIVKNRGYCSTPTPETAMYLKYLYIYNENNKYQLGSELSWMTPKGDRSTHNKALKALKETCHQNVNMFSLKKKKNSLWKLVYIGFGVNILVFQLIETIGNFIYQCSLDLLPSAVYCQGMQNSWDCVSSSRFLCYGPFL